MLRLLKFIARTLSVRFSLMVVSAMTILLVAALTIMLHYAHKAMQEEALQKATQTLEGMVQHIDNILLSVEQATGNLYFSLLGHLDQPDMMATYCEEMLKANPHIVGCAIAFRPNYFEGREYFMAYAHRPTNSLQQPPSSILLSDTFGDRPYTEQVWFTEPMEKGKPCWLNPLKGMDADLDPLVTFSLPILDANGQSLAVFAVDVSLSLLSQIVLAAKPSPNSYCTLLGSDGSFIVHPDSIKRHHQTVFTQTNFGTDPSVKKAAEAMVSGQTGYQPFRLNGIDYYVFYKPFKRIAVAGRSYEELGWSAGIIYPEEDIFGDYNRLIYYVFAIAILGLLLLFVLIRAITHHQLKPLVKLTESTQRISEGNYSEPIPECNQHDEIGSLQNHFHQMQQSLAVHIGELQQITDTLKAHSEELRIAYDKAQQANRLKTAFLHNMTNQMTGPASTISMDVEALCDFSHDIGEQEADRLTEDIQQQGKTITVLLNELLVISQEKDGKDNGLSALMTVTND